MDLNALLDQYHTQPGEVGRWRLLVLGNILQVLLNKWIVLLVTALSDASEATWRTRILSLLLLDALQEFKDFLNARDHCLSVRRADKWVKILLLLR